MLNEKEFDIKEECYKCSKCGLCQSVCPTYLATKNEMFLPRGRYIVLNNYYNNSKQLTNDFIKNLDVCLNCNLCKNFCPSAIDTKLVNFNLKNKFSYKYSYLNFSTILKIYYNFISLFKYVYKFIPFKSLFLNSYIDNLFSINVKRKKPFNNIVKDKVIYFEGCFNKYINPSDKNACLNVLDKMGYSVLNVISNCCGYPYMQEGNFSSLEQNTKSIVAKIPSDVAYIVCSCESCYQTLKLVLAEKYSSKLVTIDELLSINNVEVDKLSDKLFFKPLISDRQEFIPSEQKVMKKKGLCSLMENFFSLKYKRLSNKILNETFYSKDELNNELIYTTCLISKWGLLKNICKLKSNAKVYTYSEMIDKLYSDNL